MKPLRFPLIVNSEGDVPGSKLIGDTYAAGEGPGIYIVSNGGYRVYLCYKVHLPLSQLR
jgi:hypothetical protein